MRKKKARKRKQKDRVTSFLIIRQKIFSLFSFSLLYRKGSMNGKKGKDGERWGGLYIYQCLFSFFIFCTISLTSCVCVCVCFCWAHPFLFFFCFFLFEKSEAVRGTLRKRGRLGGGGGKKKGLSDYRFSAEKKKKGRIWRKREEKKEKSLYFEFFFLNWIWR